MITIQQKIESWAIAEDRDSKVWKRYFLFKKKKEFAMLL